MNKEKFIQFLESIGAKYQIEDDGTYIRVIEQVKYPKAYPMYLRVSDFDEPRPYVRDTGIVGEMPWHGILIRCIKLTFNY